MGKRGRVKSGGKGVGLKVRKRGRFKGGERGRGRKKEGRLSVGKG